MTNSRKTVEEQIHLPFIKLQADDVFKLEVAADALQHCREQINQKFASVLLLSGPAEDVLEATDVSYVGARVNDLLLFPVEQHIRRRRVCI